MKKPIIIQKFSEVICSKFTSESTIKTYYSIAEVFIYDNHPDSLDKLTLSYITRYLLNIKENKSTSSYNQYLSVLKILYRDVFKQKYKLKSIKPIKTHRKLISLPTSYDVLNVMNNINNLKHKTIILILFSTGVRMSELLDIKIFDIDSDNNKILIRCGKGGKSRFVPLPNNLLFALRKYYYHYKPRIYLFEGNSGKYSSSSVNKVIKRHFGDDCYAHKFRHIFITYMIEKDVNIKRIKLISGHSSDRSVEFYYQYTNASIEREINPINELLL